MNDPEALGAPLSRSRRAAGYLVATVGTGVLALALVPFRDDIDALSMGWAFLAVVVFATLVGGLGPGITASLVAFATYNFAFFPPYGTFRVDHPEHVVVLLAFLALSALISVLLARARWRAERAEARERELRLQQDLATALVDPSPENDRHLAVLRLAASRLGLGRVDLYVTGPSGSGMDLEASTAPDEAPAEPGPGENGLGRFPLVVGRRAVGLLIAYGDRAPLSPAEQRTLTAFGDQLALVLERDRLLRASADHQREGRPGAVG